MDNKIILVGTGNIEGMSIYHQILAGSPAINFVDLKDFKEMELKEKPISFLDESLRFDAEDLTKVERVRKHCVSIDFEVGKETAKFMKRNFICWDLERKFLNFMTNCLEITANGHSVSVEYLIFETLNKSERRQYFINNFGKNFFKNLSLGMKAKILNY